MIAEKNNNPEFEINDPHSEDFRSALGAEDELGVVIRTHIYVESELNTLIQRLIPFPEFLTPMEMDYFQRVHLTIALGLKEEMKSPLIALGTLRNKFSHNIGTSLSENVVENFYKTFSGPDKQIIHACYDRTRKDFGNGMKFKMKSLNPKDKFTLYAITIRQALLVAIHQFDQRTSV